MCGRFAIGIPKVRLEELLSVSVPDEYAPRFNVAPGQESVVVIESDGRQCGAMCRWGLVPNWADDARIGFRMINARSESVFEKPAFSESVRKMRCLVPVQAFYEWKKSETGKQPYAIGLVNADVFALAGITAQWKNPVSGEVLHTFSILTCAPNARLQAIHDRMPVILPRKRWSDWLDSKVRTPEHLTPMLASYPNEYMRTWPVGSAVNKPANDGPDLLEEVAILKQGRLF